MTTATCPNCGMPVPMTDAIEKAIATIAKELSARPNAKHRAAGAKRWAGRSAEEKRAWALKASAARWRKQSNG